MNFCRQPQPNNIAYEQSRSNVTPSSSGIGSLGDISSWFNASHGHPALPVSSPARYPPYGNNTVHYHHDHGQQQQGSNQYYYHHHQHPCASITPSLLNRYMPMRLADQHSASVVKTGIPNAIRTHPIVDLRGGVNYPRWLNFLISQRQRDVYGRNILIRNGPRPQPLCCSTMTVIGDWIMFVGGGTVISEECEVKCYHIPSEQWVGPPELQSRGFQLGTTPNSLPSSHPVSIISILLGGAIPRSNASQKRQRPSTEEAWNPEATASGLHRNISPHHFQSGVSTNQNVVTKISSNAPEGAPCYDFVPRFGHCAAVVPWGPIIEYANDTNESSSHSQPCRRSRADHKYKSRYVRGPVVATVGGRFSELEGTYEDVWLLDPYGGGSHYDSYSKIELVPGPSDTRYSGHARGATAVCRVSHKQEDRDHHLTSYTYHNFRSDRFQSDRVHSDSHIKRGILADKGKMRWWRLPSWTGRDPSSVPVGAHGAAEAASRCCHAPIQRRCATLVSFPDLPYCPEIPLARSMVDGAYCQPSAYKASLYMMGGFDASYNTTAELWRAELYMPYDDACESAHVNTNDVHTDGVDSAGLSARDKWLKQRNERLRHHCFVKWTEIISHDPATKRIYGRTGHSAARVGRQMFVFGGKLPDSTFSNDLYAYHVDENFWRTIKVHAVPRSPRPAGVPLFAAGRSGPFEVGGRWAVANPSQEPPPAVAPRPDPRYAAASWLSDNTPQRPASENLYKYSEFYIHGGDAEQADYYDDLWCFVPSEWGRSQQKIRCNVEEIRYDDDPETEENVQDSVTTFDDNDPDSTLLLQNDDASGFTQRVGSASSVDLLTAGYDHCDTTMMLSRPEYKRSSPRQKNANAQHQEQTQQQHADSDSDSGTIDEALSQHLSITKLTEPKLCPQTWTLPKHPAAFSTASSSTVSSVQPLTLPKGVVSSKMKHQQQQQSKKTHSPSLHCSDTGVKLLSVQYAMEDVVGGFWVRLDKRIRGMKPSPRTGHCAVITKEGTAVIVGGETPLVQLPVPLQTPDADSSGSFDVSSTGSSQPVQQQQQQQPQQQGSAPPTTAPASYLTDTWVWPVGQHGGGGGGLRTLAALWLLRAGLQHNPPPQQLPARCRELLAMFGNGR